MEKKKEKYYSIVQATKKSALGSRELLTRFAIKYQFAPWAIGKIWITGDRRKRRYIISQAWIDEFNKLYKTGKIKASLKVKNDVHVELETLLKYCEEKKIATIKELKKDLNEQFKKFQEKIEENNYPTPRD